MSDILDEPIGKQKVSLYPQKRFRPIFIIGPILIFGFLMKMMYWPGNVLVMLVGLSAMAGHAVAIAINMQRNDATTNIGAIAFAAMLSYRVYAGFSPNGWIISGVVAALTCGACLWYFRDKK